MWPAASPAHSSSSDNFSGMIPTAIFDHPQPAPARLGRCQVAEQQDPQGLQAMSSGREYTAAGQEEADKAGMPLIQAGPQHARSDVVQSQGRARQGEQRLWRRKRPRQADQQEDHALLVGSVQALKRELKLAIQREQHSEEFISSIQMLFTNDLALSPESRSAVFKAASAYSETMEHQGIDRSVARAGRLAWQEGWASDRWSAPIVRGVWHAVICCNANAELTFEATLPNMSHRRLNLQQLIHDPAHIFLSRLRAYAMCAAALLDESGGDPASAAASRAQELGSEVAAVILAKAGRVTQKLLRTQEVMMLPASRRQTPKHKRYLQIAAEMRLSLQQKQEALARREVYWFEMGRVLWRREQLLEKLQVAAVRLEEEAEGELEMWLMLPRPASLEVVSILDELRQSMDYQKYLMRNFNFQMFFEVLTPYQFTYMLARSLPFYFDVMTLAEAIAVEEGSSTLNELLARHLSFPLPNL